jgi:N-acetylglucosaminyl-diphospho-decaprenol L-rhamnosyltransferase
MPWPELTIEAVENQQSRRQRDHGGYCQMKLLVIIINYRTPQITVDCLASLAPQIDDVPETQVVVVDNGSGDNSVDVIFRAIQKNGWDRWAVLKATDKNLGFAGGNNLAMDTLLDHQETKYVLLLNSDTVVHENALRHCFEKMETDRSLGLMSCMLLNTDQTVQNTARRLPTPHRMVANSFGLPWLWPKAFAWADLDDLTWDRHKTAREVEWVGGAFMFIRRRVIDKIGGLDTNFFFYGEDVEFCHRARQHGWKVWYDPTVSVMHLGGASSDPSRLDPNHRDTLTWQARYLLQRRCYGLAAEILLRTVDIVSSGLRFVKLLVLGGRNSPEFAAERNMLAMLLRWPTTASKR